MVYLAQSPDDPTSQPQMAPPDHPEGPSVAQEVLVAIGGTLACMMTVCIVVTFTRCCCRRRKDDSSSDEEPDQEYAQSPPEEVAHAKPPVNETYAQVITELQHSHAGEGGRESHEEYSLSTLSEDLSPLGDETEPLLSDGQDTNIMSVKDKIRAFETRGTQPDVRLRESTTPKRKKPKSKAFEDFEREGILIGYGNIPRDLMPHVSLEAFPRDGSHGDDDDMEAIRRAHSVNITHYMEENQLRMHPRFQSQQDTTSEGGGNDEFEAVQRNSAMLKSFRRAPPPKNRNRARRSGPRKSGFGDLGSGDYETFLGRPPPHPGGTDTDTFEESLHMSSDRPPSRQLSGPYTPTHNGHRTSDSDISDPYDYCQPRRRSLSESGPLYPHKPQPRKRVTYLSTQGLSHDSTEGHHGQGHEPGQSERYDSEGQRYDPVEDPDIPDAPHEEGPVSFDMPTYRPNMQTDNRYNSSPVVRMSPQRCSPESPPSARKWGSEVGRGGLADAVEGSQASAKPNTEQLARKFRPEANEEERVYPKSEKLNRKPLPSQGHSTPPHLLYRPFYQSWEPLHRARASEPPHDHHASYTGDQLYPGKGMTSSDFTSHLVVHFNIDTEPTNV